MWFTKNFKSLWWGLLVVCLSYVLAHRLEALEGGDAKPVDFLLIVVWLGVCLAPLFAEIQLPGIRLKQKMEELKESVTSEVASIRNEIRNSVDVRSNVSPSFSFGVPPPDYKLGEIQQQIEALATSLQRQGYPVHEPQQQPQTSSLTRDEQVMFSSRRDLEVELRALAERLDDDPDQKRFAPVSRLLWLLTRGGLLDKHTASLIREVYSVCSLAIHGERVSEKQVSFVLNTAPELIGVLRAIRERDV